MNDAIRGLACAQPHLAECDHYDHKSIESSLTLREFLAGMLSYQPAWVTALYGVRWGVIRLLGGNQEGLPQAPHLHPQDVAFTPEAAAGFFTVEAAAEDRYWMVSAKEQHLDAYLVVAADDLGAGRTRFHVGTIVRYNSWAGPVYFNLIRPFHHIVVGAMMRAGAEATTPYEAVQHA